MARRRKAVISGGWTAGPDHCRVKINANFSLSFLEEMGEEKREFTFRLLAMLDVLGRVREIPADEIQDECSAYYDRLRGWFERCSSAAIVH